jgi:acetyl-CoA carboxylase carboxyl transferase subunit beta
MQEGIISLMQMAKTSGAVARHTQAGQLYISVITDPTTGGVTASFAMLGDIILAEPGVTLGFAGKRVIQDTIGAVLPDRFQTSEFVYEHGFIDKVIHRSEMPSIKKKIIALHGYKGGQ